MRLEPSRALHGTLRASKLLRVGLLLLSAIGLWSCGGSSNEDVSKVPAEAARAFALSAGGDAEGLAGLDDRPSNTTCRAPVRPPETAAVQLVSQFATGGYAAGISRLPGNNSRFYVINWSGYIERYRQSGNAFALDGVFVDLRDRVLWGAAHGESGLLAIAFDPNFSTSQRVYLYYSAAGTQGTTFEARLSRFLSRDGGLTLDPGSEEVLLRVPRTGKYHFGGSMQFGPDGYLYLGSGDGSTMLAAQNLGSLLGKMIRIDVSPSTGYGVPRSNPFVGTNGARGEIFAMGFRNPWGWSFDRATGEIWLGDVGMNKFEEINKVVAGGNYGWPILEGTVCTGFVPCVRTGLTDPHFAYPHEPTFGSNAIIGGFVYRGSRVPELRGVYVFGDTSSRIFALRYDGEGRPYRQLLLSTARPPLTFSQDDDGEINVGVYGFVQRLVPAGPTASVTFPERLSQTGCMLADQPWKPASGLVPYDVNSPLWSDGASKERWFALPNGTTIRRLSDGDWDLPVGSVTVKSFRIKGRLVETRLMVRHDDGDWAGYSYEWNDAQTDAFLLPAGKVKTVEGQQWTYPSRSQCLACHTDAAGRTLGLETAQLNRDLMYPATGRTANQLSTLDAIGTFSAPLTVGPLQMDRLADPANTAHGLESRARSYLHANCAMCHRPNGPGQGPEDFRYSLPTSSIGAVNVIPTQSSFGLNDPRLIYPGKPERSIISHRLQTLELGRMPPLGSVVVDAAGLGLINQWIRSGLGMGSSDTDNDGFADNLDNCPKTANASQLDSNGNGIGNACDADFNKDGMVNAKDLAVFQLAFGSKVGDAKYDANCDMNGDGRINALDLAMFQARFGKPPGDR